jgi:hypothetical protein
MNDRANGSAAPGSWDSGIDRHLLDMLLVQNKTKQKQSPVRVPITEFVVSTVWLSFLLFIDSLVSDLRPLDIREALIIPQICLAHSNGAIVYMRSSESRACGFNSAVSG